MADVIEEQVIWYPGIYGGRTTEEYTQIANNVPVDEIYELVRKRAEEDGEWAIANDRVGGHEQKMRDMMAFVSDEKNILQALDHLVLSGVEQSVDFVCRDLANASSWAINAVYRKRGLQ